MICSFCGDPAAHDATGCRYGARTLACHRCVVECWTWVRQHTGGKSRRPKDGRARPALTFYESAGLFASNRRTG